MPALDRLVRMFFGNNKSQKIQNLSLGTSSSGLGLKNTDRTSSPASFDSDGFADKLSVSWKGDLGTKARKYCLRVSGLLVSNAWSKVLCSIDCSWCKEASRPITDCKDSSVLFNRSAEETWLIFIVLGSDADSALVLRTGHQFIAFLRLRQKIHTTRAATQPWQLYYHCSMLISVYLTMLRKTMNHQPLVTCIMRSTVSTHTNVNYINYLFL